MHFADMLCGSYSSIKFDFFKLLSIVCVCVMKDKCLPNIIRQVIQGFILSYISQKQEAKPSEYYYLNVLYRYALSMLRNNKNYLWHTI